MTGCSTSPEPTESTTEIIAESPVIEYTAAKIVEPPKIQMNDLAAIQYNEAKLVLEAIVPKGLSIYEKYRQSLPNYSDISTPEGYCKLDPQMKVSEIKSDIESVFTAEIASSEFYSYMFDLEQYKIIDDVLYVNPEFGVLEWRSEFNLESFELMSWDDTSITVQIEQTLYEDVRKTTSIKVIRLVKQGSDWRIASSLI